MNTQVKLHFALGRSVVGPSAVDVCQQSQNLAYIAGSCIVVRSFLTGREHVIEASNSPLTCLNLSPCGRYVATGEGGDAQVRIHDVQPSNSSDPLVFAHHSHGVAVVKFIPNSPFIVSVGVQQDAQICLWNYQTKTLVESSKLAVNVKCLALSDDNSVIVTAGEKHLKFWNLSPTGFAQSRSAILANQRSSTFIGCVFLEANRVLAVTEEGAMVEFVNKKYVNAYQWNDVKPTSIALTENVIVLGCSSGSVALHSRTDLSPLSSLPLPIPSYTDPAQVTSVESLQRVDERQRYSPVVAVSCTAEGDVVSVHADHSMYVHTPSGRDWRRLHSDISHYGEITAIVTCTPAQSVLPPDTFITGGTDGTVRIWHRAPTSTPADAPFPQNNLLSSWLKKVLFLHEENNDTPAVSCLALSAHGSQIAVGTKSGNLHIFDAISGFAVQEVITAHDGDVLAMCFSETNNHELPELFASGGKDGLIHIFLPTSPNYTHCGVVEEHTSAINTLVLVKTAMGETSLFSGAVDGNLLVHRISFIDQDTMEICRLRHISLPSVPISITSTSQAVLVSCENASIRYMTPEGEEIGYAEVSKDIERPVKATAISVDYSGTLIALSDSKETLLVRTRSGRAINRIAVGAKATTFSADGRKLLLATEYSCVFSFKLSKSLLQFVTEDRALLEQQLRRSPSADSLLGSGSEGFVDEATTSNSQITEWDSDESEKTQPEIVLRTEASKSVFTVLPAQVTRRSTSNLLSTHDPDQTDLPSGEEVDESQSDFISRRDRLTPNLPTASKSMLNIRDGGVQLLPPSLESERPNRRQRGGWGPPQPSPPQDEWRQPSAAFVHSWSSPQQAPQYVTADPVTTPLRRPLQQYQRWLTEGIQRRPLDNPSSAALAQIQSLTKPHTPPSSAFRRESEHRVSLSKRHMDGQGPKAVWSAHALTPKRMATPATPSGAAASAITRRQSEKFGTKLATPQKRPSPTSSTPRSRAEDYQQSPLHLRSRSQSPNHMILSQLASRELSKRRDSDMSYTAASTRLAPASSRTNLRDHELRKSTDALNKIAALRKQMHQSTENLRKSTENLAEDTLLGNRARSISNLRGAQLEAAGTFDVDRIPGSLLQSRMMARSMGNVSQTEDVRSDAMPTNRLQNALSALRKASNPDLTQASLYDEGGIALSADKTRRRGAVQKKVERYHPRNRAGRQQTSEESDSNTSDASLLNQNLNRRLVNSALRSASTVEARGLSSRRMYEQVTPRMNPARRSNYLTQKLATEDVPGPDLGSDDSPRSSVNASEWHSLLDDSSDCQQLVKHVQDCCDQHRVHTDRLLQARKMVEACSLTNDQKRIIMSQIDREMDKSVEKLYSNKRANSDTNGNDYQPTKGVQALKQGFQTLHLK